MRDQVSKIVLRRGFENKKNKGERIMKKNENFSVVSGFSYVMQYDGMLEER